MGPTKLDPSNDQQQRDQNNQHNLDDFEILKTIGTGTFGRVCLCQEKQPGGSGALSAGGPSSNKQSDDNKTKGGTYWALKILLLKDVIRLKQVEHVKNEKRILAAINHPFIVRLEWSHHDDKALYMLLEYVCGGELFSYLRHAGRFSPKTACFYSAEIVSALEYLHSKSIVYRDLKPENLLLDREGHLKITDFGFAKKLTDRTWTLCGTPEYLAPEIIQSKGHNKAVDWWALGVLMYEMLAGYPPFFDDNPFGIYEKILACKLEWPRTLDPIAKDLIKKLLVADRTKRLGNMKNGAEDIKRHRWFKVFDWQDVIGRKLEPPIVPKVDSDGDTSNFDDYPEQAVDESPALTESQLKMFEDF
ncbi:cAMP-dependent protein kinase catalytic subunit PRKX isoform X1 [Neocloeon triangulifer]|uniref:cAMP-dependent protein kinase catalytic subunit PRKX isoform X1 n=1 Tax=Neocloeon triangulifer TaxID=2078957 RepID=UPI00286F6A84|nr:cAMP-dependent protein kinase catalytic subunit PRKX isoform X1 [Neocloeon triangulifer]